MIALAFTTGTAGSRTGWNAQCVFGSGPFADRAISSGYGAPSFTHWVSVSTASAGRAALGGIGKSPSRFTAATSRLFIGSAGETTGPLSAPAFSPAAVSSRSPALCFFAPWHE